MHSQQKPRRNKTDMDREVKPVYITVGRTNKGTRQTFMRKTTYFFKKLIQEEIPTHYISSDIEKSTMIVKKADVFGQGLEVICRFRAVGSFYRRYGAYCTEGQDLGTFVEFTLKDDEREDPVISRDAMLILGILDEKEYDEIKNLTIRICQLIKKELLKKDLELYDIKLEFGRDHEGDIMLIDEISGGNMRVYKAGQYIPSLELENLFFQNS